MISNRKKFVMFLVIGLIFPLIINTNFYFRNEQNIPLHNLKKSEGFVLSFIYVDDNWSATTSYDWCYGNGSWGNPYIIENVTIDASNSPTGSGILINNSKNEYFIIRNCTIFNADYWTYDSGIRLENTNNGTIINNTCSDNKMGIYLFDCEGNNIIENTASNNYYNGIYLDTNCDSNNITGNTANNNHYGIQLYGNSDYNNITLNTVNENVEQGILINGHGGKCGNNIIFNNTANENDMDGIKIDQNSDENSIINNTVNDNIQTGISLLTSNDINVTGNIINNNKRGIYVQGCENSNIRGNTINSNLIIGIYLYYNSDSNEIKNNTINRNDLGIMLDQSDYNNITGNDLKDNNWCILETDCVGNIIEYNDCSSPTVEFPIYIDDYATGVGAHNWTWAGNQTWCSGLGTWDDPYVIEDITISGFGLIWYGIDIRNSNVSFIIRECLIYNSNQAGIYLDNVNNSRLINNNCSNNRNGISVEYSNNITIFENIPNSNSNDGIRVSESNYVNITGNTVDNNGDGIYIKICNFSYIIENIGNGNGGNGILLDNCFNNTVSGNTVNDNGASGILIDGKDGGTCEKNIISGNNANGNENGIFLEESDYNSIIENIANDNDRAGIILSKSDHNYISENSANDNIYNGIYLESECDYNIILENYFNGNQDGIYLYYSDFNDVRGNTANSNDELGIILEVSNNNTISENTLNNSKNTGIYIEDESDENDIIGNIIYNNSLGIYFEPNCVNNSIYNNFFLKNGMHAIDDGIDNDWNCTTIGNYWDNHTGPDTSPNDGIVDDPYTYIGGSAGSIDYLPIADDVPPSIVIYSPSENEVFGITAPSFSVMITDVFLDKMWYTLDGGLNNYTFTENGTINQAAWNALPEGNVTITFYARDIAGNEAFEEVTIIKRISPGGIDPTIVIVIVVVSVVGGVAVIAGVYIFMKKRATPE